MSDQSELSALGPMVGPGTRIEIDAGALRMCGRVAGMRGQMLLLAVPDSAPTITCDGPAVAVRLAVCGDDTCWVTDTMAHETAVGHPPILFVGPIGPWRRQVRRRAERVPCGASARLRLDDGTEHHARAVDVSRSGVLLLVVTGRTVDEGSTGTLSLRMRGSGWSTGLRVRVARVSRWLTPRGQALHVGLAVEGSAAHAAPPPAQQPQPWCLEENDDGRVR